MNISEIKKYFDSDHNYISFRDSENVSLINRNNTYGTPTGIYTYPCRLFRDQIAECKTIDDMKSVFPFLGRHTPKFLYVYTLNDKMPHLTSDSTLNDIKPFYQSLSKLKFSDYQKKLLENLQKYLNNEKEVEDDFYGGFMKSFSVFNVYDIRNDDSNTEIEKFWTLIYHLADDDTAKWSNILRGIGLHYLVDNGTGYIHNNEPKQAVIINNKCVKDLKIIDLIDYSSVRNKIKKAFSDKEFHNMISLLFDLYDKDRGFFWRFVKLLINEDVDYVMTFSLFFIEESSNINVINILEESISKIDPDFCKSLSNDLIFLKLYVNKFGDKFIKKYVDEFLKTTLSSWDMIKFGDDNDDHKKVIVASLLDVNRRKAIEFFNKHSSVGDEKTYYDNKVGNRMDGRKMVYSMIDIQISNYRLSRKRRY